MNAHRIKICREKAEKKSKRNVCERTALAIVIGSGSFYLIHCAHYRHYTLHRAGAGEVFMVRFLSNHMHTSRSSCKCARCVRVACVHWVVLVRFGMCVCVCVRE